MDTLEFFTSLNNKFQELPPEQHISAAQGEIKLLSPSDKRVVDSLMPGFLEQGLSFISADCVVVLLHGIRDHAAWHCELRAQFKGTSTIAEVYSVQYGHFDLVNLMLHRATRGRISRNIESQISTIVERHSNQRVIVIAHSYGTYLLSHLFEKGKINNIYGAIFCGSIVSAAFNWSGLEKPLRAPVINDCGTKDIYPLVANAYFWSFGTAGRTGFHDNTCARNRYHNCGHGGFFSKNFTESYWLPYIERGRVTESSIEKPRSGWFLTLFSQNRFMVIAYSLSAALLYGVWLLAYLAYQYI